MPVVLLILAAVVAGAWVGARRPAAAPRALLVVAPPVVHTVRAVAMAPEHLLSADDVVSHTFTPSLTTKAAIVVDSDTGRVIWSTNPHQRRRVASLTKIMTALLALERLGAERRRHRRQVGPARPARARGATRR